MNKEERDAVSHVMTDGVDVWVKTLSLKTREHLSDNDKRSLVRHIVATIIEVQNQYTTKEGA